MGTITATVEKTVWTELTQEGVAGIVSSNSGGVVYVRQASDRPAASVLFGHPLKSNVSLNLDLSGTTEKIYVRLSPYSGQSTGMVAFTKIEQGAANLGLWFDGDPWIDSDPWYDGD